MSEHYTDEPVDQHATVGQEVHERVDATGAEATGHPVVDEVLATLDGLEERPVAEHVSVFESAHDRLRSALADAGDDGPGA